MTFAIEIFYIDKISRSKGPITKKCHSRKTNVESVGFGLYSIFHTISLIYLHTSVFTEIMAYYINLWPWVRVRVTCGSK